LITRGIESLRTSGMSERIAWIISEGRFQLPWMGCTILQHLYVGVQYKIQWMGPHFPIIPIVAKYFLWVHPFFLYDTSRDLAMEGELLIIKRGQISSALRPHCQMLPPKVPCDAIPYTAPLCVASCRIFKASANNQLNQLNQLSKQTK